MHSFYYFLYNINSVFGTSYTSYFMVHAAESILFLNPPPRGLSFPRYNWWVASDRTYSQRIRQRHPFCFVLLLIRLWWWRDGYRSPSGRIVIISGLEHTNASAVLLNLICVRLVDGQVRWRSPPLTFRSPYLTSSPRSASTLLELLIPHI